jgi:hypothetical protein
MRRTHELPITRGPRFRLGQTVATPGAVALLEERYRHQSQAALSLLVRRHVSGDWSEMDAHDRAANEAACGDPAGRILSAYTLRDNVGRIWVITEADRSRTTILLPDEY